MFATVGWRNPGLESSGAPVSVVAASIPHSLPQGVNAGMRVMHNLVAYEIKAVMPDVSGRVFLDLAWRSSHDFRRVRFLKLGAKLDNITKAAERPCALPRKVAHRCS